MEWLILLTLVAYYGLQAALAQEINRRASLETHRHYAIRTMSSQSWRNFLQKSRNGSEKVNWKIEGF